ncbi:MAG: glycine cleavage system protein GcvH [Erysipelotrichia bacterium]|nr:glycine cleavage system protein GcvH [Erysipelotrichia bacterium]
MKIEEGLLYTKTHEWVKMIDDTTALIGLTDYAQDAMGDIVFVSINEGDCTEGEIMGDVESVKAVSDIYAPVTGTITEVNQVPQDDPAAVNSDPYGTWLCRVENITAKEELLDAAAYLPLTEKESE